MYDLNYYANLITGIRRGNKGIAPHKPLLLLSLIDTIEEEKLTVNRIPIDERLYKRFDDYWKKIVDYRSSGNKVLMPLHHLKNDGFWSIKSKQGKILNAAYTSKKALTADASFGQLDEGLFQLLQDAEIRDAFRTVIYLEFFPDEPRDIIKQSTYFNEENVAEDVYTEYVTFKQKIISGFMRGRTFRKDILQVYDNTCCVSGLNTKPVSSLIQACHIVQHSESGNQSINNGIALCANLHLAFDLGFIGFNEDYRVLISKDLQENETSAYSIRRFKNQKILLPKNTAHYPKQEYLAAHRERFDF